MCKWREADTKYVNAPNFICCCTNLVLVISCGIYFYEKQKQIHVLQCKWLCILLIFYECLQNRLSGTDADGEAVAEFVRSIQQSQAHVPNDFRHLGIAPGPHDNSDNISITGISATAVPYTQVNSSWYLIPGLFFVCGCFLVGAIAPLGGEWKKQSIQKFRWFKGNFHLFFSFISI